MKPPLGTCLALALAGCSAAPPSNPFKIPRADVAARIKTIALSPVELSRDLEGAEAVRFKFETLVAAKLREGGFRVAPSAEYAAIWRQKAAGLGGIFDSVTGKRNEAKTRTAREQTLRALETAAGADALLDCALVTVRAEFTANLAEWDGMAEYVPQSGAWSLFGPVSNGTTPALSLRVTLSDLRDAALYDNMGGVQLLSKLYGTQFVDVPAIDLFIDEARNAHAVEAALNPLVGKTAPPAFPPR